MGGLVWFMICPRLSRSAAPPVAVPYAWASPTAPDIATIETYFSSAKQQKRYNEGKGEFLPSVAKKRSQWTDALSVVRKKTKSQQASHSCMSRTVWSPSPPFGFMSRRKDKMIDDRRPGQQQWTTRVTCNVNGVFFLKLKREESTSSLSRPQTSCKLPTAQSTVVGSKNK